MSRRCKLPLFALVLSLAGLGVAVAQEAPEPAGTWSIEGGGTVEFTPAPKGVKRYLAKWNTPSGKYEGIGIVRANRLMIGWGKDATGVMFVTKDGEGWKGEWVAPGNEDQDLGRETWTGATLEGAHDVQGTNPTKTSYTCTVACEKKGDVYYFSWNQNGKLWTGVGLKLDEEHVAIGFGTGNYGAIIYDLSGGDTVEGRWSSQKDTRFGVERITRKK